MIITVDNNQAIAEYLVPREPEKGSQDDDIGANPAQYAQSFKPRTTLNDLSHPVAANMLKRQFNDFTVPDQD